MKHILIAGFGFMGSTHAQAFAKLKRVKVSAIFDSDVKRAAALARRLGLAAPIYDDFDRALAENPVDAVDICLPVIHHRAFVLSSLKAGKAIFCEKPLGRDAAEASALARAAKRAGVIMQVGLVLRFWPEYQALEAIVREKRLGRLLSIAFQRRGRRQSERKLRDLSPYGPGFDTHLHDTDFIHHLLGRPRAVTSTGIPRGRKGWWHLFTLYRFDGVAVTAEGGHSYPVNWGFRASFQAVFEGGAIEYDSTARPTLVLTEGTRPRRPLAFSQPRIGESRTGIGTNFELAGFYNELAYFIECLERGRAPKIGTPAQAADSTRTVMAEIRSARSGRTVRL